MSDPIQSFLAAHDSPEAPHIPQQRFECCCGDTSCAYLKHNQSALDGLERDVSTAARLGKALLMRHEAYIEDSERERKAMAEHIESLEAEKTALEKDNAAVIEENRTLLDQLEALNTAITESDAHVTSLQATLHSTQRELQKLNHLASRTEFLEKQLEDFEKEQTSWQSSLQAKEQSERSAVRRWQDAERTLSSIQEQIESIEQEAKEERARHAEIVARMERRQSVERELGSAAGRLKDAAAIKNRGADGAESNVVSHFVKDILQDNANLQMGIVELREMLNNSNDEVESLRNQISLHQPMVESEDTPQPIVKRSDLNAEMSRANSQELHVHHHYHAPAPAASKAPILRRPKKKRLGTLGSGHFSPSSGSSTPRSSFSHGTPTSTAAILQQTAASVPTPISGGKRWSLQSNQTISSMATSPGPSSPRSTTNRSSSIFDRVVGDTPNDSSRPTTPDSEGPGSPVFAPGNSKRGSNSWSRTYSAPLVQRQSLGLRVGPSLDTILSVENLEMLDDPPPQEAIPEEDEIEDEDEDENENRNEWESSSSGAVEPGSSMTSPLSDDIVTPLNNDVFFRKNLRRAASHESLVSVSGMDIHTLRTRPSQLLAPYAGRTLTSQAVLSDTNAHAARPVAMSRTSANSRTLLTGMAAEQRQPAKPNLGKQIGGWVFGRWGTAPMPHTTTIEAIPGRATKSTKTASPRAADTNPIPVPKMTRPAASVPSDGDKIVTNSQSLPRRSTLRLSGVNQSGPIQGFGPIVKTPIVPPILQNLDEAALRSVLEGGK